MPPFSPSLRRLAALTTSSRGFHAREVLAKHASSSSSASSPVPVIPTCPAPTCPCSATPPNLDIDQKTPLNGTIAAYQKHILVGSGQTDWLSKIENEKHGSDWGHLVAELKRAVGRRGEFHDSVFLFPAFQHLFLDQQSPREQARNLAEYALGDTNRPHPRIRTQPITKPTILVCSHGGRDKRCGIIGLLLVHEFRRQLRSIYAHAATTVPEDETNAFDHQSINVGGVSHVGGHKWAGNVILYIPPGYEIAADSDQGQDRAVPTAAATTASRLRRNKVTSPLAGTGIWYGRVEPRHVQGMIEQTLLGGKVIEDLFRGGIDRQGHPLRL
ncbi:hypothetical protein DV736_g2638, partial [Chaetothyriales sp. CBS 134916]